MSRSFYQAGTQSGTVVDPFIDLLFNALLGFVFLFLTALLYINPKQSEANVEKQAEFVISASWPENLKDDIDLWVRGPDDQTVSYLKREAGWLHLDRDDRGEVNDIIIVDGVEKVHPVNQEIVTIRKKHPGEYIANIFYYDAFSTTPIPVDIRVDQVNPVFKTVYRTQLMLNGMDDEQTAVRFTVNETGDTEGFNNLPIVLTPYALDHTPSWAK